jgi:hypothetical protein
LDGRNGRVIIAAVFPIQAGTLYRHETRHRNHSDSQGRALREAVDFRLLAALESWKQQTSRAFV